MFIIIAEILLALLLLGVVLKILFPLPSRDNIPPDQPVPAIESPIATRTTELASTHPGKTGLYLLPTGIDAFAMRLALADSAQQTIDARYYIWEGDLSGKMLLSAVIAAADRGARVRLLIDDNPTAGLDDMWAAANSHPNITVRIFNPLTIRAFRPANYLFDFPRLNRRMHNKSFTVDGVATVIGGRNVGDEYFGARSEGLFIDLDTLAIGAAVPDEQADFERYWSSEAAYPAESILHDPEGGDLEKLKDPEYEDAVLARNYRSAAQDAINTLASVKDGDDVEWADTRLVSDNPDKAFSKEKRSDLLAVKIAPVIEGAKERFDLVSGYFVPGHNGTRFIAGLAGNGIKTRVITNSFAVTDVPVVHAGYYPYRPPLLLAGVNLFEARPMPGQEQEEAHNVAQTKFSGGGESVHAKTFAIDNKILYVGSFNFDPRSALLNCEMGLLIDSPRLATAFNEELDKRVPEHSYQVKRTDDGKLTWTADDNGKETVYTKEPDMNAFQRTYIAVLSKLPIEWML
ncbi:MAG: phospholipase D family protein [Sphingomonadaceae bacterium]